MSRYNRPLTRADYKIILDGCKVPYVGARVVLWAPNHGGEHGEPGVITKAGFKDPRPEQGADGWICGIKFKGQERTVRVYGTP